MAARTAWATFVAAEGSLLVGMATGMPNESSDAAVLVPMYVRPDARGHGRRGATGRRGPAVGTVGGFARIELGVNSGNERAARLCARCGFERTGEGIHHAGYGDDIRMPRTP